MAGATKRERAKFAGKVPAPRKEEKVCFPHKWTWSVWETTKTHHRRWQKCSKCQTMKPGSMDISTHRFSRKHPQFCTVCNHIIT